ncbi:hypothetical protein [Subtercola sp. YIM 133946]|uniref:hypothetical protein n=1 Tax=Subtercola sp. YIM 133946 TaxID=3118909 RepID=UPI002F91C1BD
MNGIGALGFLVFLVATIVWTAVVGFNGVGLLLFVAMFVFFVIGIWREKLLDR